MLDTVPRDVPYAYAYAYAYGSPYPYAYSNAITYRGSYVYRMLGM